jgi:nitrogen regulatory protein PII
METSDVLITFIVSHGDAQEIMATAREAGARGGTILEAHGTSRESDVQFFGMTLVLEKEMLIIVADKDNANNILNAVKDLPVFKKTGGGIIYTTDVQRFIP